MTRTLVLLALLVVGCSSSPDDKPTRTDPPADNSTGGKVAEDDVPTNSLCLEPGTSPEAPQSANDTFTQADTFGNDEWSGAYYLKFGTLALQELGSRTLQSTAEAGVSATLAGTHQELARAVLEATARDAEPAHISSKLVFVNQIVYPLFEFTATFTTGDDFTHQMLEVEYPFVIAGEISVSGEFEAWVTLGYQVSGQAHIFGLSATFEPHAAVVAAGGVSVGDTTDVVEAGLVGSFLAADVRVPIAAGFMIDPTQQDPKMSWFLECGLDLKWLSGNLTVYVELLKEKRKKLIVEWPGFESSHRVGFGDGSLILNPPSSQCGTSMALAGPPPGAPAAFAGSQPPSAATPSYFVKPTFEQLVSTLSANPSAAQRGEALSQLKRLFRRGEVSEAKLRPQLETRAGRSLLAALGADGSAGSLEMLLDVIRDPRSLEHTRMSAIASLGLSPRVTPTALQALQRLGTTSPLLDETLMYAIANAANTLAPREPTLVDAIAQDLATRARMQAAPRQRAIALRALGNIGTEAAQRALSNLFDADLETSLRPIAEDALNRALSARIAPRALPPEQRR